MTATNLPGLDAFIESMIALAVSIGFLVILLSMYTTIIDRTNAGHRHSEIHWRVQGIPHYPGTARQEAVDMLP